MKLWVKLAGLALLSTGTAATAGPPYLTDDPEPTDLGHWEIYSFAAGTISHGTFDGAAGFDLNYGALPEVQLTATLPLDIVHDGGTHAGVGDIELGVKYRFIHGRTASVAIFPRVILPTADHRFGTGHAQLLLPVWAQSDFGAWSLFGGGGYMINPGSGNRNFWQEGIALTRSMSEKVSIGAEVTHQGAEETGGHRTTALGVGGIIQLGGPFAWLVSGGPAFEHHGSNGWNVYTALALNF